MSKKNKRRNKSRVSPAPKTETPIKGESALKMAARLAGGNEQIRLENLAKPYVPPAGVVPKKKVSANTKLANDSQFLSLRGQIDQLFGYNTMFFKGYPHYANLFNMPEGRKVIEVMATEMTRKWIEFKSTDDSDVSEHVKVIESELNRLNAQNKFSELIAYNYIYGRGQLYINLKNPNGTGLALDDPEELKSPLILDRKKILEDGIESLNIIEPIQTTAAILNSVNPLKKDYYEPTAWFVAAREVHSDRILTLITNPVASYLKPAFNYGGLSLLQLIEPTLNNWLAVRDSGKDLVVGSNIFALKTNMQNILADSGCDDAESAKYASNLTARAKLFAGQRRSNGLMLLDKESEELENINVSMAGIAEMITKYQEQLSQITGIPIVKLTGNTPSGLNASSEGEIQVFYDMITALKEAFIREPLKYLIDIIQVAKFGEINESITFDFVPMKELTEKEKAEIESTEMKTLMQAVDSGVINDLEAKSILKNSGNPHYTELDLNVEVEDEEEDPENKLD